MEPILFQNTKYYLTRSPDGHKYLCVHGDHTSFSGEMVDGVYQCPLTPENAAALRDQLSWLRPQPLGLATSFGFGDRLGLATPGHLRAVRGTGIAPIFAQQSVRENTRTGRSPRKVLDDAMWAVFEQDWHDPWGADADHIKTIGDLPPFIDAGYSFYTIDPNEHVDNQAQTDNLETLKLKVRQLPWHRLDTTLEELTPRIMGGPIDLGDTSLIFTEEAFFRSLAKYGGAIAHIKSISDYLSAHVERFDLEASVDETDTPTSMQEHYYFASELRRLSVPIVSLAPRFVGSFEKGVDYIGDLTEFELALEQHTQVMHAIGGYKLSIHTGSDKFSIYPVIAEKARKLVHVKTAGTSFLEALRVVALADRVFFREILDFSRSRYDIDRATYHVSGQVDRVATSAQLSDDELLGLFDQFDARQVLHVTFGSILDQFGARLMEVLRTNLEMYDSVLYIHFMKHLGPFINH